MEALPAFRFEDAQEGESYSFSRAITAADLDAFVALTGDCSNLHVDGDFARSMGFDGRVVHGAFQAGMISKLVGTHFPAASCLLHGIDLAFPNPAYIGDTLNAVITVKALSESTRTAELRARIRRASDGVTTTRGSVRVGFLQAPKVGPAA